MTELLTYCRNEATLADALTALSELDYQPEGLPALLYSAERCWFAKYQDGQLRDHRQESAPLESIFEARLFCPRYELRWQHGGGGRGRAAMITTNAFRSLPSGWDLHNRATLIDEGPITNTYLIWGKIDDQQAIDGWTTLFESRFGEIHVPTKPVNPQARYLQLTSEEYCSEVGDFGNVCVIEEQLTGFSSQVISE